MSKMILSSTVLSILGLVAFLPVAWGTKGFDGFLVGIPLAISAILWMILRFRSSTPAVLVQSFLVAFSFFALVTSAIPVLTSLVTKVAIFGNAAMVPWYSLSGVLTLINLVFAVGTAFRSQEQKD